MKRSGDRPGNIFNPAYLIDPLGDGLCHTNHICLLKSICPQQGRCNLSRDDHKRCTVHHRVGDAGDGIGSPRTGGDKCHTHLLRYACIALCCMKGSLLMAHQNMFDLFFMIIKGIEHGHDGPAGIPEQGVDTLCDQ